MDQNVQRRQRRMCRTSLCHSGHGARPDASLAATIPDEGRSTRRNQTHNTVVITSWCNTPECFSMELSVPKFGGKKWRFIHDLRQINVATVTDNTPVPKPYVTLNNVRPEHQWFSVVDLANAFFCYHSTTTQPGNVPFYL